MSIAVYLYAQQKAEYQGFYKYHDFIDFSSLITVHTWGAGDHFSVKSFTIKVSLGTGQNRKCVWVGVGWGGAHFKDGDRSVGLTKNKYPSRKTAFPKPLRKQ